ncbi:MAG: hypothetical protein CMJ76_09610 [Planctomycetaceae bacterium]|nr:hypothetical protein [Planctomycetaceae bacterium]|tara:strand:- start:2931 stop:3374 length:444 start_codon:yes stop_codon:yes gene_type:complete
MAEVNVLLAVDRDNAKAMFSAREPDAMRSFFNHYQYSPEQRLDLADCWQEVKEYLQKIGQENERLAIPLSMAFNGGRQLLNEPPQQVFLVRPDVVAHLGNILSELNLEEIEGSEDVLSELVRLRDFYAQAAKSLQCVVFTTGILCDN